MSIKVKDIRSTNPVAFIIVLLFMFACNSSQKEKNNSDLIPLDLTDTLFGDFRNNTKEYTTDSGWKISYLVKDDSTKYEDVYIKWEKGKNIRTLNFPSVLSMRHYFLPVFKTESKTHIFLEHGCATSCTAVTALPKNPEGSPHVFYNVVDYDVITGRVVYIPQRSYSLDTLELDVFDLKSDKAKTVSFQNQCNLSPEDGCIEKVTFTDKSVELIGTFTNGSGKIISEKQTAVF